MSKSHKALTQRLSSIQNTIPENQTCCECSASNPDWAFLLKSPLAPGDDDHDLIGAFICRICSRAHKRMNERVGKQVKSIIVGSWTTAHVRAMARGGNDVFAKIFEDGLSDTLQTSLKPTPDSDEKTRQLFLQLKYGQLKFYSAKVAQKLIPANTNSPSTDKEPSKIDDKRAAFSSVRQNSMPSLGLSPQRTPSRSGRRGVRRVHSNDDWEALLSPASTGVYSQSMSTISTKSTLFGKNNSNHHRVQIAVKQPSRNPNNVSLDSFIEINNSMSQLDLNVQRTTPPILESGVKRPSLLDENHKDTRPKMCRRVQSSRTLGEASFFSQDNASGSRNSRNSRSNQSRGRRTKSLDTDLGLDMDGDILQSGPPSQQQQHSLYRSFRRRGSTGSGQPQQSGRRRGSMGSGQPQQSGRRRGSMGSGQPQSGGPIIRRRGSMGNSSQQQLSLESDSVVRRRGSMGSRRKSSVEQKNGQHRANLSRRNLSLDSHDIMGSPTAQIVSSRAQRQVSLTESTSQQQRERPKYTRRLSASSMVDSNDAMTPEPPVSHHHHHQQNQQREPWMEGKTPRTTGRRRSLGMDSVPSSRRNSMTGGMKNPMDQSDCSQKSREPSATRAPRRNSLLGNNVSNHGAAPGILRRGRSKRNFARSGSSKSLMDDSSELSPTHSIAKRQGGLISGDKKRSSSKLSLRSSLGVVKRSHSTDSSDLTSSRLGGESASLTSSSHLGGSNVAVTTAAACTTSTPPANDLASKLHEIDREAAMGGYNVFGNEHKSPTSPLTTSTGSKRVPQSLRVVLHAQDDENRTFVSTVTGNTSLESHWSLHKERWKA